MLGSPFSSKSPTPQSDRARASIDLLTSFSNITLEFVSHFLFMGWDKMTFPWMVADRCNST